MVPAPCPTYTHMGSLSSRCDIPALRIIRHYFSVLDSLDFDSNACSTFFADGAIFYDSMNTVFNSSSAIWDGLKARFDQFEFMHHQICLTRVFGPDVRYFKEGDVHVVSVQAMMLCRLKNWEEERIIEVPRMFEFIVGRVEDQPLEPREDDGQEDVEQAEEAAGAETNEAEEDPAPVQRGFQGLQICEARVWWDSGVITKAIEQKAKEEERRRFIEIMTRNNGFLGQRPA